MQFIFYNNSSDPRTLRKTLTKALSVEGVLKSGNLITAPEIELEAPQPFSYNYCQIPLLNRYYFIQSSEIETSGLCKIKLKCDVLMSFKDEILNLEALVSKSASNQDSYLTNSDYRFRAYPRIQTRRFSNDTAICSNNSLVLATIGG